MKHIYIISAIIGVTTLGGTFAVTAGQPYRTDYPAIVQMQQNAQAQYQNKMREWSIGLGVDLPGAPRLASAVHNAPATAKAAARTGQPCHSVNYQNMKPLQLAKETEYQRRMREWATGLGMKLPGTIPVPDMLASNTSFVQDCIR